MDNIEKEICLTANRTAKDSVFTDIFSEPENLLKLYKTLHPEDTEATVDSLKNVTLENILTNNLYNDIGFTVGDKMLILIESQSTWSSNILIRVLMYVTQTYQRYIKNTEQNYYNSAKVKLPIPEIYIIFTGERKHQPEMLLFSEEFFDGAETHVEVKAKIIYDTGGRDIINQYIMFCKVITGQIKLHGPTKKAVEEAIRICTSNDILRQYLSTKRMEVITMFDSLFSQKEIMEMHDANLRRESRNEGRIEGRIEGRDEGRNEAEKEMATKMIKSGKLTINEISSFIPSLSIDELIKMQAEIN